MRVVYAINSLLAGGGIGDTAYYSALAPYKNGCLVRIVSLGYATRCEIPGSKIICTKFPSRRYLRIPEPLYYLLRDIYFDKMLSNVLQSLGSIDILHAWDSQCMRALDIAKKQGAKIVLERASSHILLQRELLQYEYQRAGIRQRVHLPMMIYRTLYGWALADKIKVPSPFVFDSMVEKGISADHLELIPFGVDSSRFVPGMQDQDDVFRVLFVGQVSLRKGIQYLLQAWAEMDIPRAELIIVGALASEARTIVSRYVGLPSVKMVGFVPNPVELFQDASVFVFPSIEEGSALVTYEAMACGVPVVTTYNAGSVVRDGQDGYIVPIRDTDALKQAILRLYENKELRREMGRSARLRAEEFSWERHGERLIRLYEEIQQDA